MSPAIRPRRSLLFMPGSNPRALEKGREVAADGLIMDLEDAVAPEAKHEARARIVEFIGAGGYGGRELVVRINGADTQWFESDLQAIAASGADGVLIPKVDHASSWSDSLSSTPPASTAAKKSPNLALAGARHWGTWPGSGSGQ